MGRLLFCGSNLPVDTPVTGSGTFGHLFVSLFVTFWLFYAVPPRYTPSFVFFSYMGVCFAEKRGCSVDIYPQKKADFKNRGSFALKKLENALNLPPE